MTTGCGVASQAQNSTTATAIKSISPTSVVAGGPSFSLVVSGTGFTTDSVVTVNNQVRTTTFLSATQLKAVILASDIGNPGPKPLSVFNVHSFVPAFDSAALSVQPSTSSQGSTLAITTTGLPTGAVGVSYSAALSAANGVPPYTWGVASGQLPPGLNLLASTGQISGAPSQAGTFAVTVQVTDSSSQSTSAGFSANIAPQSSPVVTSITPNTGPTAGGTSVTINGANFLTGATVSIGGSAASSVTVTSSTQIRAVTPGHLAGNADVIVQNANGEASTLNNGFVYNVPSPTVASVSPNTGPTAGGTRVTITGTNFLAGALILFGSTQATSVIVNSAIQIQATTPAHAAGPADVTVEDPGNITAKLSGGFTYNSSTSGPPTITNVSPTSGAPGTQVTITGTNFTSGATVAFGSTTSVSTTFVSPTELISSVPTLGTGIYSVTITVPEPASATMNNGFTVTPPARAGNQGLLSGMTPSNFTLPAGWTLATKQDFETGSLPPGQALVSGASITCSFGHSGNCSAASQISHDNASDQWFFSEGQLIGREYYLSFYDNGTGVLFNEEYVLNHMIKHNLGGSTGFEESAITIFANGTACQGSGGIVYNCPNAQSVNGTQGNYVHQNNADYGPNIMGYGSSGWNQWEIWVKANTPNNSDGWLRVYRNGILFWDRENINEFGPVDMTGMQVEAGGWYTKNVWTNNGERPNAGGRCSAAAGVGAESGTWIGSFNSSPTNAGNCGPAPPVFTRYIDDIILLEK